MDFIISDEEWASLTSDEQGRLIFMWMIAKRMQYATKEELDFVAAFLKS